MSVLSGVVCLDPAAPETTRRALDTRSSDGRWHVAWSGRLDNRRELCARFTLGTFSTDARLAADALAAGGIHALGHAIGDFAIAAWDTVDGCLWLARDAIGFRPLFYAIGSGTHGAEVRFATAMRPLANTPTARRAPNAGFIAEMLAGLVVSIHETPLDGVRRVLPAEALRFRHGEAEPRRVEVWRPPTSLPPRRDDADLIAECRAHLSAAVEAALDGHPLVGAHLSGGLDSTSVVVAATAIRGAAPDTYSIVYPGMPRAADGEMLDESAFIDLAVAATGARSVRFAPLGADALTREDFLRVLTRHGEIPDLPITDALNFPLFARAAADGHTAMLTGFGGDYWLTGSLGRLPWLVRRGRLAAAWRFLCDARRTDTLDAPLAAVRAHFIARFTPAWARSAFRRVAPSRDWPDWIPDRFAREIQLGARLRRLSARVPDVDDDVLRDSLVRLTLSEGLLARESLYRAATDAGIEVRHPFMDRRFVEFAITLPDDLRMRGAETRYILRRAMAPLVPDAIRDRRSKGDATTVIDVAIAAVLAGAPFAAAHASARGWIDPARIAPRVAPFVSGDPLAHLPSADDDLLWAAVAVEEWLASAGA